MGYVPTKGELRPAISPGEGLACTCRKPRKCWCLLVKPTTLSRLHKSTEKGDIKGWISSLGGDISHITF